MTIMRKKQVRIRTLFVFVFLLSALIAAAAAIALPQFAHASTNYVGSGDGNQQTVSVVVTFYGYNDNSGQTENQYGSADIAYPQNAGYPTLHNLATEGKGTYNDPVTFAVRPNDQTTFPIGSIAYFPLVHKYFIMEDGCEDNDPQGCLNGTHHTDLWFGPQSASDSTALQNCEDNSTPGSSVVAVINPNHNFPVDTTTMFQNNQCTIHLYDGNTVPSSGTPTPTPTLTPTPTPPPTSGIVNGGFETGNFTGWTTSGTTSISRTAHSSSHAAELGTNSPTNGNSSLKQTFTAPSGTSTLSFWYDVRCPDDVAYDWATASLKDNTTGTITTILAKTCTNSSAWVQVSSSIAVGHSYTLTLISHDENNPGDPTYTLYDDVVAN